MLHPTTWLIEHFVQRLPQTYRRTYGGLARERLAGHLQCLGVLITLATR